MTALSALLNNTGWAFYPRRCLRPRYQFFFTFAKGGGAPPLDPPLCSVVIVANAEVSSLDQILSTYSQFTELLYQTCRNQT